jgi:hypothetical protein
MEKGESLMPNVSRLALPFPFSLFLFSRQKLDVPAYDACVTAAPNAVVYALSWWLDLVSPGWEVLVWPGTDGTYRAVLPVPVRRKYGIRFVQQPLFAQFLGIFSPETVPPEIAEAFGRELARRYRFVVRLALRPGVEFGAVGTFETLETHVLSLDRPHAAIRAGYSADRRMNLKRAERAGWVVVEGREIGTLVQLFQRNHSHRIAGGADPAAYPLLERLFAECEARGLSTLRYAVRDGQIEAGAWFVTWGGRAIYLFNAATEAGRRGNARTWLIDQFLAEHAESGLLFDFESPAIDSIADFYQSFGAQPEPFGVLRYNRLPGWVKGLWRLKKTVLLTAETGRLRGERER